MGPEQWPRLEALVQGALARDAAERAAWLEAACAGDRELLDEVRSLLQFEERARGFLETPALARDPEWIVDYRIVRRLAAGGSAIVFEARKQDRGEPVALKVLRGGLFVEEHHRRQLRREVRTLARLEHPGIARLIEAGTTGDGEVFLAMELVEGLPIDAWARERGPSTEELLRTFQALCEAVHHAHGQGVVHRDLKPGNVLVEASGRPRVLDFGLARLLCSGGRTSTIVRRGEVVGTLDYMSPEQARGRPDEVDLRTDVYALGVILYQLVTGSLPLSLDGLGAHEALAAIGELAPRRPTLVRPGLDRALETIVLTAIAKRPSERYPSAAALGADVLRHLQGRPIAARGPGPLRRLRGAAAAHKLASGLLASGFLALLVFGATVWTKNLELREERARAVEAEARASEEAARSEAVLECLQAALATVAPGARDEHEVSVRELLVAVEASIDGAAEADFGLRARLHATTGRAYLALGRGEEAARQFRQALELSARDPRAGGEERATLHRALGQALFDRGDYAGARAALEAALPAGDTGAADPLERAELLVLLGRTLVALDRREEARVRFDQAAGLLEAGAAAGLPSAPAALTLLAEVREQQGALEEAELALREALAPEPASEQPPSAEALAQLGYVLVRQEQYDEALEQFEQSLALREREHGPNHPETLSARQNLATLLVELGRYEQAEPMLAQVAASLRALHLEAHEDYASTLAARAAACSYLGRNEEAVLHFRAALEAYRASGSRRRDFLANHLGNLSQALIEVDRTDEALELTREALAVRREHYGERHPVVAKSIAQLGDVALRRGELEAAEARYREALELARPGLPPGSLQVAEVENSLGSVLEERGELEEAESLYRSSLEACAAALGDDHPSTLLRRANLGRVLVELERDDEAEPLLAEALAAHAAAGTGDPGELAVLEEARARALLALDRHEEAVPLLEHAGAVLGSLEPVDRAALARTLATHGRAELELGEPRRAVELLEAALERAPDRPEDPLRTCQTRRLLAKAYLALGREPAAEALLVELADEALEAAGPDDPRTTRVLADLERVRGLRASEASSPTADRSP